MAAKMVKINLNKHDAPWHIPVNQEVFDDCEFGGQIKVACGRDIIFLCEEDVTDRWVRDSKDVTIAETCQSCLKAHITKPRS